MPPKDTPAKIAKVDQKEGVGEEVSAEEEGLAG